MENMQNFTFIKTVRGALTISLDSYDFSLPTRPFTFRYDIEKLVIPFKYALGIFVSSDAKAQLENGFFSIEQYEILKQRAADLGLYADAQIVSMKTAQELDSIIVGGNVELLKTILKRNNHVEVANIINIARSKLSVLKVDVVRAIEESCGVELEIE